MSTPIDVTSAELILSAFKKISEQTLDNKYKSVRKHALVSIGNMGRTALKDLVENHYGHRPGTPKAARFNRTTTQTVKNADESLKAAQEAVMSFVDSEKINAEQDAFKFYSCLATEEYLAYCKDPFCEENCSSVRLHFSYSSMDDEDVILSPPYLKSYKSLRSDPNENY